MSEPIDNTALATISDALEGDAPRPVKRSDEISPIELGKVLAASGYFRDAQSASQAAVKVLAGQELGIKPIAAMTGIYIVKDKVFVGASLLASIVQQHPRYRYEVKTLSNEKCTITFYDGDAEAGTSEFSIDDAKRAGTQNIDKFPRNMLFARAMSNGVKWYVPGVLGGLPVYTEGEIPEDAPPAPEPANQDERLAQAAGLPAPSVAIDPNPEPEAKPAPKARKAKPEPEPEPEPDVVAPEPQPGDDVPEPEAIAALVPEKQDELTMEDVLAQFGIEGDNRKFVLGLNPPSPRHLCALFESIENTPGRLANNAIGFFRTLGRDISWQWLIEREQVNLGGL